MKQEELQNLLNSLDNGLLGSRKEHHWDSSRRMSLRNKTNNPAKGGSLKGRKPVIPSYTSCRKAAERRGQLKPVSAYKEGKLFKTWPCIKDAAKELGCSPSNIRGCVRGAQKTALGMTWKYIDS